MKKFVSNIPIVIGLSVFTLSASAGTTRNCVYDVYFKSKDGKISESMLTNSTIKGKGVTSQSSRTVAKNRAKRVASECLKSNITKSRSQKCKNGAKWSDKKGFGEIKSYGLYTTNLTAAVSAQICAVNATMRLSEIKDVYLFAKRKGGDKGCGSNKNAFDIGKISKIECSGANKQALNLVTKKYSGSANRIKKNISKKCKKDYSLNSYKIHSFSVNERSGALTATYDCKK